jgi:hypothetical protein
MKILGVQRFELLVADPEAEARRLGDLLGLDFERSVAEEHGVRSCTNWDSGLDLGPVQGRFRSYRQVSPASESFPGRASFTFAEYEEA